MHIYAYKCVMMRHVWDSVGQGDRRRREQGRCTWVMNALGVTAGVKRASDKLFDPSNAGRSLTFSRGRAAFRSVSHIEGASVPDLDDSSFAPLSCRQRQQLGLACTVSSKSR